MASPDDNIRLNEASNPAPGNDSDATKSWNVEEPGHQNGGLLRKLSSKTQENPTSEPEEYDIPDDYTNLDELADAPPVDNPAEPSYERQDLEDRKVEDKKGERTVKKDFDQHRISRFATQLYVVSYLILFSLLGTLARLGLQAINAYPGAPVEFNVLWANFGGCLIMGFLTEDRMLFKQEWGTPTYHQQLQNSKQKSRDEESGSDIDISAAKKAHTATKKTIPLYIGLATGFCGSFTSFSSFIRDAFLAMSNALTTTGPRNGGYSFMALLAVIITTITVCISALFLGAHIAIALEPYTPSVPFRFGRKVIDKMVVFVAWGCWLGAVLLAISN